MAPLPGSHVLIIGGTSGIGLGISHEAFASGARLTIASSSAAHIESTIAALKAAHPNTSADLIHGHPVDLSDPTTLAKQLEKLFSFAASKQQLNHVVVTAADRIPIVPLDAATPDAILEPAKMRMVAPILIAQTAAKYLPKTTDSSLTLTTGASAVKPPPNWSVVSLLASGTRGLTKGLAVDMKPIRVNCVQAGVIDTSLWDSLGEEAKKQTLEVMAQHTLLGRVGKPADVAQAYKWLMTDGFVTGTVAESDGGYLLV